MTEYKTAFGSCTEELDIAVNALLKEGWQLYGHPYASSSCKYQAMIKCTFEPDIGPPGIGTRERGHC